MKLILIRHGEAAPGLSGQDAIRQLTVRGHQQAELTAKYIAENFRPDLFVVSPYTRAQQTLAHIQENFPDIPTQVYKDITPDDPATPALHWLSNLTAETIVVVCHMNIIAYIAALLTEDFPESFALAEARVYEQPVIMVGLSQEKSRFVPYLES
ncbi:histidine phosphatase family protein [Acinetobacter qingfengensis]|uniref:Phosphohistidine phosphatase n=1 Tax=Acinetobacter qingfengensis TaxID=1262585 RepID=A0A1E7RF04_9GAMM|nr:phosphoglycerate mutase family protein [Acinetobacter qingfengensis]KAA8735611.1 histidine phosphatase family protein [Acinetobacter qingfengensis]OEY97938.1 phosphohistidine phosphatase [Acinetobacter qingfengensis]